MHKPSGQEQTHHGKGRRNEEMRKEGEAKANERERERIRERR